MIAITEARLPAASVCTPAKPLEIKPVDPKLASFGRIAFSENRALPGEVPRYAPAKRRSRRSPL
jgi:hypothetical protein